MQPYQKVLGQMRLNLINRNKAIPALVKTKSGDEKGLKPGLARVAYLSAKRTEQLHGLGQADFVETLKAGSFLPDNLAGFSTKTVLTALVVFLALKK